jgi:hypothetical protein
MMIPTGIVLFFLVNGTSAKVWGGFFTISGAAFLIYGITKKLRRSGRRSRLPR